MSRRRGVGVGDGGGGLAARVFSARPTPRSSRGVTPCRGARHEESNLEPRQLGAAGADHHREISAQPPCQAAPTHGQPGQATAERAAQRRPPNGSESPGGHTTDSLMCAAGLPTSGTAPPMAQPESRASLLTCLGRHTGAHPPAANEAPAYAAANRLKRLGTIALTAPSHERVVLIHLCSVARHPICVALSVPDAPAGQISRLEVGGPWRRKWRAIDSDFST